MADGQTRGPQLPIGTTVIDPRGRVGQIATWLGGDRYEVRYPDDLVAEWMGNSLHLQKHSQRDLLGLLPPRDGIALVERGLILRTVTGSRIFGLDIERACRLATSATGDASVEAGVVAFCDSVTTALNDACSRLIDVAAACAEGVQAATRARSVRRRTEPSVSCALVR